MVYCNLKDCCNPIFAKVMGCIVVREVSSTKEITFYRSTKWTKDRSTPPILASSKREKKKKWDPEGKSRVQMATQNV
jgi:hypothetical protein